MSREEQVTSSKSAVALLLTFAAGFVDIVGFLAIYQTFTAHMTGNTVHFGNNLVEGHARDAIIAGSVLAAFLFGSIAGRTIIEMGARTRVRRISSFTFGLEAALIAAFIAVGRNDRALLSIGKNTAPLGVICALLALLAVAMGLQTATLTRVGPLTVHTTFVTGMLNKFAQLSSHVLFHTYDMLRGGPLAGHRAHQRQSIRHATFIFLIWVLYLTGAITGTWLESKWQFRSLFVPIVALLLAISVDQAHPLSLEEEKDQSER